MKKTFLLLALFLSVSLFTQAQIFLPPDTSKVKEPPIKLPYSLSQSIEFNAPATGVYSILIESNGNIVDLDEVSLSLGDVHTIDMSAFPNGNYRVLITDIISGVEYEYFYRKDDDFVTI